MPVLDYRKAVPIQAAFVGSRLIDQGQTTQGVGKETHVSRSRDEGSSTARRGNTISGVEFGGRRRSRKTRKHKKTHRRR